MKNISELKTLPENEMTEIQSLSGDEKRLYFIAGYVDFDLSQIILFRGDGTSLVAPFMIFENVALPFDFKSFSITAHGQFIKLGDYETSIREILEAVDPKLGAEYDEIRNRKKVLN